MLRAHCTTQRASQGTHKTHTLAVSTLRLVNFGKIHVYCFEPRALNSTFRTSAELILAVDFGLLVSY